MPFLSCGMSKFFLRNTNNTNRDSVDKLKTHTHTHTHTHTTNIQRKIMLGRFS